MGQTKRQFCTRLKEHHRAVSNFNSSKSALAEHVCQTSHSGKILKSLPLTIVMVKGFVWKPGISMRALVPYIGMTKVIYYTSIYILLVNDVTLTAHKVVSFNIRPPLTKTLDRSVETLGRECNLCSVISYLTKPG